MLSSKILTSFPCNHTPNLPKDALYTCRAHFNALHSGLGNTFPWVAGHTFEDNLQALDNEPSCIKSLFCVWSLITTLISVLLNLISSEQFKLLLCCWDSQKACQSWSILKFEMLCYDWASQPPFFITNWLLDLETEGGLVKFQTCFKGFSHFLGCYQGQPVEHILKLLVIKYVQLI